MYLQFKSGCIQEISDKRKLVWGGNKYLCPINVINFVSFVTFSVTQESWTCSCTDASSFILNTALCSISFTNENCFAISHNSAKLKSLSFVTRVLEQTGLAEHGWRKPLLSPSWTKLLVPSNINCFICTIPKDTRKKLKF